MAQGQPVRWELTAEERTSLERAHGQSLTVREMLFLLIRSPRLVRQLAPEFARVAWTAARGLPRGDMVIASLVRGAADRRQIPDAGLGVGYLDFDDVLAAVERYATPEIRALELGCGGGRVSVKVAPLVGELVATDVSKAMIAEARRALSGHPNADCATTDGFTLREFPDRSFDLVVAVGVLPFFTPNHLLATLVEIARVLRPGGLCIANYAVIDNAGVAREHSARVMDDAHARRTRGGVEQAYLLDAVIGLHRAAGLEVIEPPPEDQHAAIERSAALKGSGGRIVVVGRR